MPGKTFQQLAVGGDWLIREDDEQEFNRISNYILDNSAGTSQVQLPGGYPFKITWTSGTIAACTPALLADVTTAPSAGAAVINAAVLEPVTVGVGEKRSITLVARGFNVIDQNFLPSADYNNATNVWGASTVAAAQALLGAHYANSGTNKPAWVVRTKPDETTQLQEQAS